MWFNLKKILWEDGIHLFKLWFPNVEVEQKKRLEEGVTNHLKKWELSRVDIKAQLKWKDYTHYKSKIFDETSWDKAPWVVLKGNDKEKARLEGMKHVLSIMDYRDKGKTVEILEPDASIVTIV
jgi:polyphosphate kinase 2 (PPK2 family)